MAKGIDDSSFTERIARFCRRNAGSSSLIIGEKKKLEKHARNVRWVCSRETCQISRLERVFLRGWVRRGSEEGSATICNLSDIETSSFGKDRKFYGTFANFARV